MLALALTGLAGARLGGAPIGRAITRVVLGGALGMVVTYVAGLLFGGAAL